MRVCVNSTDAERCPLRWVPVEGGGADCDCRSDGRAALVWFASDDKMSQC